MGKKGPRARKVKPPGCLTEDALDERAALAAIYGDEDFAATDEGFSVHVRGARGLSVVLRGASPFSPCPALALRQVSKIVRYRPGYPRRAPHVDVEGMAAHEEELHTALVSVIEQQRTALARTSSVVGFALTEALRERLQAVVLQASDSQAPGDELAGAAPAVSALESSGWGAGGVWRDALGSLMLGSEADLELGLNSKDSTGQYRPISRSLSARTRWSQPTAVADASLGRASSPVFGAFATLPAQDAPRSECRSYEHSSSGADDDDDDEDEPGWQASVPDALAASGSHRRAFRQALLTGHLLTLATSPGGALPHALPQLCRALHAANMLPQWLPSLLLQRSTLFQRVFRQTFAPEAAASVADPAAGWALQRFWAASTPMTPANDDEPLSRYALDFEERSPLGRGSFGSVVLAVNSESLQCSILSLGLKHTRRIGWTTVRREKDSAPRRCCPLVARAARGCHAEPLGAQRCGTLLQRLG